MAARRGSGSKEQGGIDRSAVCDLPLLTRRGSASSKSPDSETPSKISRSPTQRSSVSNKSSAPQILNDSYEKVDELRSDMPLSISETGLIDEEGNPLTADERLRRVNAELDCLRSELAYYKEKAANLSHKMRGDRQSSVSPSARRDSSQSPSGKKRNAHGESHRSSFSMSTRLTMNTKEQEEEVSKAREEISDAVFSYVNSRELITRIREKYMRLVDAQICNIYLLAFGRPRAVTQDGEIPSQRHTSGLMKEVIDTKTITYIPVIRDDPQFNMSVDGLPGLEFESLILLPLTNEGGLVLGVVELINRNSGLSFDLEQVELLRVFSIHAGKALEMTKKHDDLESNTKLSEVRHQATSAVVSSLDSHETLQDVVRMLTNLVAADRCTVYEVNQNEGLLLSRYAVGAEGIKLTLGSGIAGQTALTGQTIAVLDAYKDPRFVRDFDTKTGYHTTSVLSIAARNSSGKIVGVIQMLNKKNAESFSEADIALCESLSIHVAAVLTNAKLKDAVTKAEGNAQTLLELSSLFSRELNLSNLLLTIMHACRKPFDCDKCSIFLADEDKNDLWQPAGSELDYFKIRISCSTGIVGACFSTGQIQNVKDARADPRFCIDIDKVTGYQTRNILAVPIKGMNGDVLGVFEVLNKINKSHFDKEDENFATAVTVQIAIAVQNAKLFEAARIAKNRSDALVAVMKISSSAKTAAEAIDLTTSATCRILNADRAHLFLVDGLNRTIYCKIGQDMKGFVMPIGVGVAGMVARDGGIVNIRKCAIDPRVDATYDRQFGYKSKSILCAAVTCRGKVIAVLQAINKLGGAGFTEEDEVVISAVAEEAAVIIENRSSELAFDAVMTHEESQITTTFLSQYVSRKRYSTVTSNLTYSSSSSSLSYPSALLSTLKEEAGDSSTEIIRLETPRDREAIAKDLKRWDFDPWKYSTEELLSHVINIFGSFNLVQQFNIPETNLQRFVVTVKDHYNDNPYHNFLHGFTTLHVASLIASSGKAVQYLNPLEMLSLCIASYCHDMGHNGRNNDFHMKTGSEIALTYNDQSVLENLHAFLCWKTLNRPQCNILCNVSQSDVWIVRKLTIAAILATDMSNHVKITSRIQERFQASAFSKDLDDDRSLLLSAIVHSADIANPTMPSALSEKWSNLVLKEFNDQYEEEKKKGVTPSPFMAADIGSPEQAKLNLVFIDSCVFPLWKVLGDFLGGIDHCLANIQNNRSNLLLRCQSLSSTTPQDHH